MVSERAVAVERVLGELRALLLSGAEKVGCDRCTGFEKYNPNPATTDLDARLARVRAYVETAADNVDRALEQVELAQGGRC